MIWKVYPAEEIDAGRTSANLHLISMELQCERIPQESSDRIQNLLEPFAVATHNDEIIRVSDIVFRLQFVLHELVELVHIHVDQDLRREIAERKSLAGRVAFKAAGHGLDEIDDVIVGDMLFHDPNENPLINGCEAFSDVAFQNPECLRVVLAAFESEFPKALDRSMRAAPFSAGIRVKNEMTIKHRI